MVKRETYKGNDKDAKVGRAYGFFAYDGKTEDIQAELPRARKLAQTPDELALKLIEGVDGVDTREDSELASVVERAKFRGMTHAFEATMPNAGNRKVSTELHLVLGNIYNSPLYPQGVQPCGGIVYKRGNKYCFRS